ncbi:MAG: hypothetical protein BA862_09765 [Desulfobulbaceae bacterium S3730MH12]|nr:MAG: hypothetical protein BA866_01900 [Desulfobulbaceae bacterium S5133MH15]OEU56150.1 MAG: hypothetical protein BA862_09765 [Desulfobulbaceae bacterium S3730MH12]OEU81242.1 MAG: hypothetical protein BA873_05640 [Desulfobulbaceae bacterium C00003063]
MVFSLSSKLKKRAEFLLVDAGLLERSEAGKALDLSSSGQLHGDGSNRQFFRIYHMQEPVCILVAPAGKGDDDLAEARSAWFIGNHLRTRNVPVPELYGWDAETGILLFEDLGDTRLHDFIVGKKDLLLQPDADLLISYSRVIEELAQMQYACGVDFDKNWCWDSPRYDQELMLERESGYFLRAFWQGLLGRESVQGVEEELEDIAKRAAEAGADYFLHRDFQCRNIMVKDGRVRFIDFQGGRMGPLGYDLASLLIDPYAGLSQAVRENLFDYYITCIGKYTKLEENQFVHQYNLLAFQRNMQFVGAFSFLYQVKNKVFFADYISPALSDLAARLQLPQFSQYPIIRSMVKKGIALWAR